MCSDETPGPQPSLPRAQSAQHENPAPSVMRAAPPPGARVRLLHFNDVYNVCAGTREPVGGASRFVSAVRRERTSDCLVLFSGDAFSPAPMTPVTLGAEISPVMNAAGVSVACIGNHDMDNGMEVMSARIAETNFPWLISNAVDLRTGNTFGDLPRKAVKECGGIRFGFMGLASEDWLREMETIEPEHVGYEDFVHAADFLARELREVDGCDFVVALTHMRSNNDEVLAKEARDIDIVLGGHDHTLSKRLINRRWVVKSGTDFRNFSSIDLVVDDDNMIQVCTPVEHFVTSDVPEDPKIAALVAKYVEKTRDDGADSVIGYTDTALDGRFLSVRTRETGMGNFITDIMTRAVDADIGLVNSGSFRSDSTLPRGPITTTDINSILPYKDEAVVCNIKGNDLLAVLENSVSQYPILEGRFCHVSGIKFAFDAQLEPGQRIIQESVLCRSPDGSMKPLRFDETYKCAMKTYLFEGKDGFAKGDPSAVIARTGTQNIPVLVSRFFSDQHDGATDGGRFEALAYEETAGEGDDAGVYKKLTGARVFDRIVCINPAKHLLSRYDIGLDEPNTKM